MCISPFDQQNHKNIYHCQSHIINKNNQKDKNMPRHLNFSNCHLLSGPRHAGHNWGHHAVERLGEKSQSYGLMAAVGEKLKAQLEESSIYTVSLNINMYQFV